ncbi:uncharacterized protein AKAME5_000877100 [Lates japonicus]|uniref:Reverse transcriptase domain-containing protein n=1 Tax=Lates japonicus TaxID=270547 RepID=A0AAD3MMA8_LATJO|nr:uncharacterized protein AKAME5_000877100 [Lates japonicus]
MKFTTCHLDPVPSPLTKAHLPSLIPLITNIINTSLTTGSVPSSLKLDLDLDPSAAFDTIDHSNHLQSFFGITG